MKNKWTAPLLAHITEGQLKGNPNWVATTFTHDSRKVEPGQLYVAIKGETVDGHDYVAEALEKGAVAALVEKIPSNLPTNAPLLYVKSVEEALKATAHHVRHCTMAKVFAVTGSSGKTTVKEMLRLALENQCTTHATPASFNSRWGLPLTLSGAAENDRALVLEMGMNAPGEILNLTQMGQPHIALITTINPAHVEKFGNIEKIAHEKGSIFAGVVEGGVAIIPADVAECQILVDHANKNPNIHHIILFGTSKLASCRVIDTSFSETGMNVTASIDGHHYTYSLGVSGMHFAVNSVAVLAAIHAAGLDVKKATQSLGQFQGASGRGQAHFVRDNVLLMDESYNANPGSMKAALDAFAHRPIQGKKYLVLGQMGELGPDAPKYHADLKDAVLNVHPAHVYTYGDMMQHLKAAIEDQVPVTHITDLETLQKTLEKQLQPNDGLLIKGSNALKLGQVAHALSV